MVFFFFSFNGSAISCLLGEHWKSLTAEKKQEYTDAARKLAEQYKERNPDCWKRRSRSHSDLDAESGIALDDRRSSSGVEDAMDLADRSTRANYYSPESDANSLFNPSSSCMDFFFNFFPPKSVHAKNQKSNQIFTVIEWNHQILLHQTIKNCIFKKTQFYFSKKSNYHLKKSNFIFLKFYFCFLKITFHFWKKPNFMFEKSNFIFLNFYFCFLKITFHFWKKPNFMFEKLNFIFLKFYFCFLKITFYSWKKIKFHFWKN